MYRFFSIRPAGSFHTAARAAAWLVTLAMLFCTLFGMTACKDKGNDDKLVTEKLITSYMEAFTDYDIGKMNKASLIKLETYEDSDDVNISCKQLAARTSWVIESINVSGNSAIAQVGVTTPQHFTDICREALDDAMLQIEQDSERLPAEILRLSIKNHSKRADTVSVTAEISLSKVNNKWYIAKSQDVTDMLSEIRTAVAAVYTVIED